MNHSANDTVTSKDFENALLASRADISKQQRDMLEAHFRAPNYTLTATQLAQAAGYSDYSTANLQYGLLGKTLAARLSFQPEKRNDGSRIWTTVIATGNPDLPEDTHFQWIMRPQLVEALKNLPWFKKP